MLFRSKLSSSKEAATNNPYNDFLSKCREIKFDEYISLTHEQLNTYDIKDSIKVHKHLTLTQSVLIPLKIRIETTLTTDLKWELSELGEKLKKETFTIHGSRLSSEKKKIFFNNFKNEQEFKEFQTAYSNTLSAIQKINGAISHITETLYDKLMTEEENIRKSEQVLPAPIASPPQEQPFFSNRLAIWIAQQYEASVSMMYACSDTPEKALCDQLLRNISINAKCERISEYLRNPIINQSGLMYKMLNTLIQAAKVNDKSESQWLSKEDDIDQVYKNYYATPGIVFFNLMAVKQPTKDIIDLFGPGPKGRTLGINEKQIVANYYLTRTWGKPDYLSKALEDTRKQISSKVYVL